MPDRRLGIEITARERVGQATEKIGRALDKVGKSARAIPAAAAKVGSALKNMAQNGIAAVSSLAEKIFFLREALNTVAEAARGLFEAFVAPALQARKVEVALTNMTGSGQQAECMMNDMRRVATETGVSLQELYSNAPEATAAIKRISGSFSTKEWDAYLAAIKRVAAYRPDLTAAEQIGIVNEMMAANLEAAAEKLGKTKEEVEQAVVTTTEVGLGRYTSIVKSEVEKGENIVATAGAVNDALEKMGIGTAAIDNTATALDRLREAWNRIREIIGEPILEALANAAEKLLKWLDDNQETVDRLAQSFGEWVAGGVDKLIAWIEGGGIQVLLTQFQQLVDTVASLVQTFLNMPPWVQKLLLGGALALGPLGGGKGLLGLAGKGIGKGLGKLFGGGAAAAGAGGAGTAAAGAGGGAAAAGGLTALGVGGSALGGVLAGFGVNELLSRTEWGQKLGARGTSTWLGVGAHALGSAIGGEEMGQKWFSGVTGIRPGMGQQEVKVTVAVDPQNGTIKPYVDKSMGQRDREFASSLYPSTGGPMSQAWMTP